VIGKLCSGETLVKESALQATTDLNWQHLIEKAHSVFLCSAWV